MKNLSIRAGNEITLKAERKCDLCTDKMAKGSKGFSVYLRKYVYVATWPLAQSIGPDDFYVEDVFLFCSENCRDLFCLRYV